MNDAERRSLIAQIRATEEELNRQRGILSHASTPELRGRILANIQEIQRVLRTLDCRFNGFSEQPVIKVLT